MPTYDSVRPGRASARIGLGSHLDEDHASPPRRPSAVLALQAIALTVMIFPSDWVLKPVGAAGFVAELIALAATAAWAAGGALGLRPPRRPNPIRVPLAVMWVITLISYVVMHMHARPPSQVLAADRWLLQLAGMSGIVLICIDCLRSMDEVHMILRALLWGGAFCGAVATLQFWLKLDVSHWIHVPGFRLNSNQYMAISSRGRLNRVSGTALQPIELGVTAAMLLPLSLYMARVDRGCRSVVARWLPVGLIGAAIPVSVARSSILGIVLSLGLFLVLLPATDRVKGLALSPVAVAGVFMTAHGYLGTILKAFTAASADTSISHRTSLYAYVEHVVREAPWIGRGGGTYLATPFHILDNQYLTTAIELGLLGVIALTYLLVMPVAVALVARWRTADASMRMLCAALAGSALAATICSATFDSLSFPLFSYTLAFILGFSGFVYAAASDSSRRSQPLVPPSDVGLFAMTGN